MTVTIRIKPSHRGLLHDDLGVPRGQKIPRSLIEQALRSNDPAVRTRARFAMNARGFDHSTTPTTSTQSTHMKRRRRSHRGEVTAIAAHHSNPNFMRVDVAHGKRSAKSKDYDDRPSSSIIIPKHHAKHYRVGDRLNVGLMHSGMNGGGMDDESAEPMMDDEGAEGEDSFQKMKRGLITGSVR